MSNWKNKLKDLKLKKKFFVLLTLTAASLASVAIFSYFASSAKDQKDIARQLSVDMLQARRSEKDFIVRKDMKYADKVTQNYNQFISDLEHLSDNDYKSQLREVIDDYYSNFKKLTDNVISRGLNEESGAEGELRNSVHTIEKILDSVNKPDILVYMLQARRSEKDFFLRHKSKYPAKVHAAISKLIAASDASGISSDSKSRIRLLGENYLRDFDKVVALYSEYTAHLENLRSAVHKIEPILDEVVDSTTKSASTDNVIFFVMFIIASLIIFYAALMISKSIETPIVMLKNTVEEFARGNYAARTEYESEDEIGDLSKAFNKMAVQITEAQAAVETEKLKVEEKQKIEEEQKKYLERNINNLLEEMEKFENGDLTASVKPERDDDDIGRLFYGFNKAVGKIKEIVIKVTDAVQATASASSEISASAEQLAAGAQQQSSQASEIASAVEEMTSTIFENTKNTTAAAETAKGAEDIANKGADLGNETVSGMLEISDVVSTAALRVKDLGQKTDQIGEIIQVIDEIADQTNLLALNAAIEAARAGEEGRGFAVVADEVRKLAERTVSATKEIAEKIKEIQDDTNGVVQSIEDGTNVAEIGKVSAQKVGDSLNEITNSFRQVLDTVTQVAAASEEQSATSEEIAKNIEAISNVTQQTASGTEQIARAAEDLNRLTDNLQLIVENFKVDDSDNLYKSKSNLSDYVSQVDDKLNEDGFPVEGVYGNGYH